MTDIQEDEDTRRPAGTGDLDECRQTVTDLTAELSKTLWEMGYFITMTCALGHLGQVECDCDERIARINDRLHKLQWGLKD